MNKFTSAITRFPLPDAFTIKVALDEAGMYATSSGQNSVYWLGTAQENYLPETMFQLQVGTVHELWSISPGTQPFPSS